MTTLVRASKESIQSLGDKVLLSTGERQATESQPEKTSSHKQHYPPGLDVYAVPYFDPKEKKSSKKHHHNDGFLASIHTSDTSTSMNSTGQSICPPVQDEFSSVTRMMLRKTEFLLQEATGALQSVTKKKRKVRSKVRTIKESNSFVDGDPQVNLGETKNLPRVSRGLEAENETTKHVKSGSSNSVLPRLLNSEDTKTMRNKSDDTEERFPTKAKQGERNTDHEYFAPPSGWMDQRVNETSGEGVDESLVQTKPQWENDIARHIISVFATTKAGVDLHESATMLEFVDKRKQETTLSVASYLHEVDDSEVIERAKLGAAFVPMGGGFNGASDGILPSFTAASSSSQGNRVGGEASSNGENPTEVALSANDKNVGNVSRTTTVLKSRKMKKMNVVGGGVSAERQQGEAEELTNTSAKPQRSEKKVASSSSGPGAQFRTSIVIRGKDGEEVVIRGSPKCGPIWFVSSGDVYTDWRRLLPGLAGEKLQMNLNVLYEQQRFKEFVVLLEKLLDEMWRDYAIEHGDLSGVAPPTREHAQVVKIPARESAYSPGVRERSRSSSPSKSPSASPSRSRSPTRSQKASPPRSMGREERNIGMSSAPRSALASSSSTKQSQKNMTKTVSWQDLAAPTLDDVVSGEVQIPTESNKQKPAKSAKSAKSANSVKSGQVPSYDYSDEQSGRGGTAGQNASGAPLPTSSVAVSPSSTFSFDILHDYWKKLILTANAMSILMIEKKSYGEAFELLTRADRWTKKDDIIPKAIRDELKAHVQDVLAYYYFARGRMLAALSHSKQGHKLHEKNGNIDLAGADLLHVSAALCQQGNFKESHKYIYLFLAMVEDGRMGLGTATPKQLCMVAIAYHNLAVVQLKLQVPDLACKSSQNARKIARLCLSFSNRWLPVFQRTHEIALEDVKFQLSKRDDLGVQQLRLVQELAETLFDPTPS